MLISLIDSNVSLSIIQSQKCCPCYLEYPRVLFLVHFYLFFIFNDFPSQLKTMLSFLFADDTKCLYVAKINVDFSAIQEDLNVACNWSKECCLSFNCSKSAVLHFWRHHETPAKYLLNSNYIEARDSIKDLGVMITSDLSWTSHCHMITSRAHKTTETNSPPFYNQLRVCKIQLYISLVQSQLLYCSQV